MKRIYYLTDNIESTEQISNDLHEAGIKDWNFHVLSKDEAGLYKRHIHSANYLQKLDIVRDAERGAMLGAIVGLLVTWIIASSQVFGANAGALAYLAIFGFVTLFGAWVGGLIGLTQENQKIAFYHNDIEAGKYLILIDVKAGDETRVQSLMQQKHPEAQFKRVGSTFINPFKFVGATA
jgi:hypothetical protein